MTGKRKEKDGELYLIDGNSLAYRAFFALPESIATSRGFPTNAIFGFASMLVKILTEHGPKNTIVVWDAGMTGREVVYPQYKAQRKSRPDLLKEQWPQFEPLVEAFGYRNVKVEGFEADDVIASIAERAKEKGIPVMIVTGDRDAYQLVADGAVKVMTTARGITDTRVYDEHGVVERYGIAPELVPDFIGLKGDTSDNIPGVPGIGDKTAAQLLQQFGSLEAVLENVDKVSGAKRKQNLTEHAEDARLSKRLATLRRDIETGLDPEAELSQEPDRSRLREVFREFELRDPLRRLEEALGEEEAAPHPSGEVRLAATARQAAPADLGSLGGEGAVALAATPQEGAGIGWAGYAGGDEVLVGEAETLAALLLALGDRPLAAHDYKRLARRAAPGDGAAAPAPAVLGHDTLVGAYLLDPAGRRYPLDELAEREGLEPAIEGADGIAREALLVHELMRRQAGRLVEEGLEPLFRDVELPLVEVLCAMERAGVKLDTYRLGEIAAKVTEQLEELQQEIWELAGEPFTIGSPQQLANVLFGKLGLSRKRRGKTGFSTDARVLRAIRSEHPIVEKVERWRELSKLKSTYLDALPDLISTEDERLHTTFNQTATATGRLSSTDPNLQNIPIRTPLGREIRDCFTAEEGCRLLSADYSQVELRVLAHCAGEDVLREIFERGEDVHTATASEVFKVPREQVGVAERSKAKAVNFGIVYGLSPFGLSEQLDISQEEAASYIERYLGRFPAVQAFIKETIAKALNDGQVTTLLGRIRKIPELRAEQHQTRLLGERLAVNTVIQGSAADIIKVAMVRCHDALRDAGMRTRLVLQIHDELLFEGPEAELEDARRIVKDEMEGAYRLDPPLAVDVGVGETWMEAK